ncbi:MAG: cell surface protein SprA [Candidatus Zixiibacteriota bacterium]
MRSWLRTVLLVWLAAALAGVGSNSYAGIQLSFDDPAPQVVSKYRPASNDFFIGKRAATILALIPQYNFNPKVTASHFDGDYLTFNTEYMTGKSLIPVAVPALKYNEFRRNIFLRQRFAFMGQRSFDTQQKAAGPGGISIGVGLPKQLDKVFGEGGGNLRVSGYRRITFSGRSSWTDGAAGDALKQSKFPSLLMDQIYRFDIEGTIGTKISVKVSEDSQTDIPLSNRIQLRYRGDEDDILKSIEAGNTNLSLPNTQFVGYSSQIQGLFGLKVEAQVARLKLTAIASQEKGSSERASVSAAGDEKSQYHRDYEYVENRIFDLAYPGELDSLDVVKDVYVFQEDPSTTGGSNAFVSDLRVDPTKNSVQYDYPGLRMLKVDPTQFEVVNDKVRNAHYIVFNTSQSERAMGTVYTVLHPDGTTAQVGSDTAAPYQLFMLRAGMGPYNPSHPTWKLMWRNAYNIPRGAEAADLNIKIFKGATGTESGTGNFDVQGQDGTFLRILGLDQYDGKGQSQSDNILDDRTEIYRKDWGLLIFPNRTPFDSDTSYTVNGQPTPKLTERVPKIYNYSSPNEKVVFSKYYYQISSKVRGAIINLNRANIIEGSERVTANGEQLTRGADYNIDYSFGRVTLLSAKATDPNASVNVDFEYAPFLTLQRKTLLGFRGEYTVSENLKVGSTVLYKSDKAQDRKPRVGQETAKMTVIDFDGTWKLYPEFITKAINALPLLATEAPSTLTISGEVAESHPNPNIANEAYIDDFESALEQLNLPSSRAAWQLASLPVQITDTMQMKRRPVLWHIVTNGIPVDSVYDRQTKSGEGNINVFRMIMRANNKEVHYDTSHIPTDTATVKSWGGITTYFGNAVDPYRAQLFEARVRGTRGRIHFDFGQISEDANGDNKQNFEDKNNNQACEPNEDVGLDGLPDSLEPGYNPITNRDPDGDDFYSNGDKQYCPLGVVMQGDSIVFDSCANSDITSQYSISGSPLSYERLNGTEKNLTDLAVLGQPDDEKLSRSSFNRINSYFSFQIDLSDTTSENSFYVHSSQLNGWKTYRIPIRDSLALSGLVYDDSLPDWSRISHVRVWMEADDTVNTPETLQVANWYFVQSNWQDSLLTGRDPDPATKFVVASVSTEDHVFVPPPGVAPYTDPSTNVAEPQRGLALTYRSLHPRDTGLTVKRLSSIDRLTGYRSLKMYVHSINEGDPGDSVRFFFRLGRDSLNFYEYRATIHPDPTPESWDPSKYVTIDFNALTALKDAAQRALPKGKSRLLVDDSDGVYRVKGDPSINEVNFYAAGVANPDTAAGDTISGTIWLDELRVTDVRRDVGRAGRIEFNGSVADLATYNFRFESRNPYFRGISATTRGGSQDNLGSGQTDQTMSISTSMNFEKFLPRSWQASIPIGYSYTKSVQTPVLRTGSDIVLPVQQRAAERSQNVTKTFRAGEGFQYKGRSLLFNVLLNRQKVNFSYSRNYSFDVNRPYSFGENYNVSGSYDMSIKKAPSLSLFSWGKSIPILNKTKGTKLYFWPTTWNWNGTFDRTLSINDDINNVRVSSLRRGLDLRSNLDYKVFDNLTARLDWSTRRDLSDPSQVNLSKLKLGLETYYSQAFSASYAPRFFKWIGTGLSYSANYTDNYDRSSDSRYSTLNRSWSIGGDFKHLIFLGKADPTANSQQPSYQPNAKPAAKPKTGSQPPKKKKNGRPFYDPPFAVLRYLTGWVDPFVYKYSESYNSTVPGMKVRPSWGYRFGVDRVPNVPTIADTRTPYATEGSAIELSTKFRLLGGISTGLGYKTQVARDVIKVGSKGERRGTSWPDLDVSISQFKTFPLIKKQLNHFIRVFEPQTAFNREVKEDRNLDLGFRTSHSVSTSYNPLLSLRFKLFRALSLSSSYSLTNSTSEQYSPTSGEIQKQSFNTQSSINVTARYSFKAPAGISLPLLGRLKVTSTVNLQLDVRSASSKTETSNNRGPRAVFEDKSDLTVSPTVAYSFSQQIQGGLTAIWQDSNDNYLSKKSHVRSLQIWAEIRF